ncbi:MAG: hypothetical protein IPO59_15110 [Betaproteobacteria bacterium]|nr:hypothetical protein [Betaproteobacteria bacterium]
MSTTTIQVNFESLRSRGLSRDGSIKLMMACNDLSVSTNGWANGRTVVPEVTRQSVPAVAATDLAPRRSTT